MKKIKRVNDQNFDVQTTPNKPFSGKVPRDLDSGDTFEAEDHSGTMVVYTVNSKVVDKESGMTIVRATKVG